MAPLKRDTALVFDLENVVDGYGTGLGARLERVSVPQIVERITEVGRERGLITEYAVKRAYADWSKGQLAVLRRVLVEQGIEPRQIFAFGSGGKTNAADVELVIDVLDLAYTRPEITTYVVVSGDGGFGTLIRKLHEFGKAVVVGAHKEKAARGLRAVADEFIELDEASTAPPPDEGAQASRAESEPQASEYEVKPGDGAKKRSPRVRSEQLAKVLAGAHERPVVSAERLPPAARGLIQRLADDSVVAAEISTRGLLMGALVPVLADHLDRPAVEQSFGNFTTLLRVALADSPWCVAGKSGTTGPWLVCDRGALLEDHESLSDLPMPGPVERLRGTLRSQRLVVPEDPADLWAVAEALVEAPIKGDEAGDALMQRLLQSEALGDIAIAALRTSLILLAKAGSLDSVGSGPFAEWSFRQGTTDIATIVRQVRDLVKATAGHDIDDALVDELLGLREADRSPA